YFDTFTIPLYGNHHILNALAVIAFCHYEGIDPKVMHNLSTFTGAKRRFSEKKFGEQIIIDDYAHHPIEIAVTIDSARKKYPNKRVIASLETHTYTRTNTILQEFAYSLNAADCVYLSDIFSSACKVSGDLPIDDLLDKIPNRTLLTLVNVDVLAKHKDAALVFMGAGDIQKFQKAYENSKNEHVK